MSGWMSGFQPLKLRISGFQPLLFQKFQLIFGFLSFMHYLCHADRNAEPSVRGQRSGMCVALA